MKTRTFRVSIFHHEENLCGASFGKSETVGNVEMIPTVPNVLKAISVLLPGMEIDDTDMSVYDCIHDSLEYGFFTVPVKIPEKPDFYSECVCFDEY